MFNLSSVNLSSSEFASTLDSIENMGTEWFSGKIIFLENWQWLTLIVGLVTGLALRMLTHRVLKRFSDKKKFASEGVSSFINTLFQSDVHKPLGLVLGNFVWLLSVESANLPKGFDYALQFFIKFVLAYGLIKTLYYVIDVIGLTLSKVIPSQEKAIDSQLVLLATRTLKVFVVLFGVLIYLQSIGLNVMSLLAGLGLGGLALALAAQDTAANLFGSVTIIADKPFKVGDYIKVAGTEGTVEEIGFRSTRIRTLHQSLLTVPNSTIAKELVDNMGMRPMRESKTQLGLVYSTTSDEIENFNQQVTQIINSAPKVVTENTAVFFHSFGDFSLNVSVRFFLRVDTAEEEIAIREQIYLAILRKAAEMKIDFAFPTQTIQLQK